jgi:putative inorganic carbon (HCO3(-)) transporter
MTRARRIVRAALLALLVLSTLPFGSVRPLSVLMLELWALGLGGASLWIASRDPDFRWPRPALIAAALLALVGLAQLTPLPEAIVEFVAGPTHTARSAITTVIDQTHIDNAPLSLAPPETLDALLRFLAYVFVGVTATVTMRTHADIRLAATVLLASAGFQAIYGSAEYLSGHQHIFAYTKKFYLESATGTFINRNHFAGYLALVLPLVFVLLSTNSARIRKRSWRELVARLNDPTSLYKILVGMTGVAIGCGILLSYSRGGLVAGLVTLVALVLLRPMKRHWIPIAAVAVLIPAALLSWQEIAAPGERFFSESQQLSTLNSRLPVWEATLGMVPSYAVIGSGFGTFGSTFRLHQPEDVNQRWDHAHNDWLQSVVEGGVLTSLAFVFLFVFSIRTILSVGARSTDMATKTVAAVLVAALIGAGVHGLIDFSARIPAVACLLAFYCGTCLGFRGAGPFRSAPADGRRPVAVDSL